MKRCPEVDLRKNGLYHGEYSINHPERFVKELPGVVENRRQDNKDLMVKNNLDDSYYPVGGRIQFGETAEQAVNRGAKEELGCEMKVDKLGFICEAYLHGTIADDNAG